MEASDQPPESSCKRESPFPELLDFASRAQSLIAELLLLSDHVPLEFRDPRFDPVLFDLRYFDSPNEFEARIEGNGDLEALDDQLRESCSAFLSRFFLLANGIVVYHLELLDYLDDLQKGSYVETGLDKLLESVRGRQLLIESMSLFGCQLLLMEHRMCGHLREKLLVAYMRYERCFGSPNMDKLCLLCRTHMAVHHHVSRPPLMVPSIVVTPNTEELFARFPFPKLVVEAAIRSVVDTDLYNRVCHFPDPQHRTVALSVQASFLYILLFYSPEFLHDGLLMRDIVDRYFKDQWVVPIFIYFIVDLSVSWEAYAQAKASLSSCVNPTTIHDRSQVYCTKVADLLIELNSFLLRGSLTREYVLQNSQSLLSLIRNCNISFRWLFLHRMSISKKLRDIVISVGEMHHVDENTIFLLLLKTSQLEFKVKELYAVLLRDRGALWCSKKKAVTEKINNLSRQCSENWASAYKVKDGSLKEWFVRISSEVHSLDCAKTGRSGKAVYRIMSELKDIETFNHIEGTLQVKQHILEVQKDLEEMVKVLNLDRDIMSSFAVTSDAVYAWGYISRFNELLIKKIEQDSSVVMVLHSFFLKFQSLLSVPLIRIAENESPDLHCVSCYYNSEFIAQIRATLNIVPVLLFRVCGQDDLQHGDLPKLSHSVDNNNLEEFMQVQIILGQVVELYPMFDQQLSFRRAASEMSSFSQGILAISKTFPGIIDLDLRNWLEEQICNELSQRLDNKMKSCILPPNMGREKLEASLRTLSAYLFSHFHVIESFQDFLHVDGYRIWREAFTSSLEQCAQKEITGYKRRCNASKSSYSQLNDLSAAETTIGYLLQHLLQLTHPTRSIFIEPMSGWFDSEGNELLGLHLFDLLESCLGQVGLTGLDSLLKILIAENLDHALRVLKSWLDTGCSEKIVKLEDYLGPATSLPLLGWPMWKKMVIAMSISWEPWVEQMAFIGQLQLLRCLISLKLKSTCKVKAGAISSTVQGLLTSIYTERGKLLEYTKSNTNYDASVGVRQAVNKQRELCGFYSPLQTVYFSNDPIPLLSRFASAFTISQLSRYVLDTHLGTLISRLKKSIIDFSPVVIGLGTFLKQFHPLFMTQYVQNMGQYIRATSETALGGLCEPQKGSTDPESEFLKSAYWLMIFCKYMGVSKDLLESCVPPPLIAILQA